MALSWVHSISQLPKRSRNRTALQIRTTFQDRSIRNGKKCRGVDGGDVSRCTSTPAQALTVSSLWCDGQMRMRTHKNSLLIFASLSRGIFSARCLNADPVRSMAFTKFFFLSDRVWCLGAVAGFCAILLVLGVAHSSIWPSEISSEAILSSSNVKSLLDCPNHIKSSNTSYIPVGDPSTETLPSGHHNYASHTCCIQTYSAAALGFLTFRSCGQRVRLEWMDVVFHCAATPPSGLVSKSL